MAELRLGIAGAGIAALQVLPNLKDLTGLVVLTALFRRSLNPLRQLVSPAGIADLAEQTVRVLRWGLWMAPIIFTFLRLAPQPTWYNQDGAVRTLVAIWQNLTLSPTAFHDWSLQVFLGLLAYDV